jgi:hypothetical protein
MEITDIAVEDFRSRRSAEKEAGINYATKIIDVVKDGVVVDSLEVAAHLADSLLQNPTFIDVTSNRKFDFARQPSN